MSIAVYGESKDVGFSLYKDENDIQPWLECCKQGLVPDDADESNFRSRQSLGAYLREQGVVGLSEIDTRKLTRILRTKGAQAGTLVAADQAELTDAQIEEARNAARSWGSMVGRDLAREVTCKAPYEWREGSWTLKGPEGEPGFVSPETFDFKVVAYDFGIKRNILRMMVDRGIAVTVVPAATPVEEVLAMQPDGVFLSNGPGDPEPCTYAIEAARVNAARAGIPVELVLSDDGLPRGQAGKFDYFVGNPPYYSDYRIAEIFLETAYRALRPGGVCLTVVKTASGLQPLQEKYFQTVEVIKRRGYCVLRSKRT